jgi:hypothetical protein
VRNRAECLTCWEFDGDGDGDDVDDGGGAVSHSIQVFAISDAFPHDLVIAQPIYHADNFTVTLGCWTAILLFPIFGGEFWQG